MGKIYFGKDVENAIIRYNKSNSMEEKNRIYNESIRKPLRTLIEAVIHRYKYYKTGLNFDTLIDDSEGFLMLQFHKMIEGKGKAFSYLTVILRNYLTALSKKSYSRAKTLTTDIEDDWYVDDNIDIEYKIDHENRDTIKSIVENKDTDLFIKELIDGIRDRIKEGYPPYTKKDIIVFDALIFVLKNRNIFEILNKKYLLYILREITGYKTKAISSSLKKLGDFYESLKRKHL